MLNYQNQHMQFPVQALPQKIREAVFEAQAKTKAPIELVVASALSAVSLTCQDRIRVERFNGLVSPSQLYNMAIAESGERKTTNDSIFIKPFREFDDHKQQEFVAKRGNYQVAMKVWRTQEKVFLQALSKVYEEGGSELEIQGKLQLHQQKLPSPPKVPRLLYRDVTPEAMLQALQNWPSAGLWSSEAGAILNGRTASNLGIFNELWEKSTLTVDRKSADTIRVEGAKLTISLMLQPKAFEKFLTERGELARDNGFLARCLITHPMSTQGFRMENDWPISNTGISAFYQRIAEILAISNQEDAPCPPETLKFSADAKLVCRDFTNYLENRIGPDGDCKEIRDFTSKLADNMARIAALFHYFEGSTGEIQTEIVLNAIQIAEFYLAEFKRIFIKPPAIPEEYSNAFLLESWLWERVWKKGCVIIKKNYLRNHGPNPIRVRNKLSDAITVLINANKVQIFEDAKRTTFIQLNPAYFANWHY